MADEEDQQLDEFGEPIPTQEELEAERSKTDQVLKLNAAASAIENQAAEPLPLPVSQGRMYLGPSLSPTEESTFMGLPSGTSMNLMPPPTPESSLGAAARVASATKTPGYTLYSDPAMMRFQAQQQIQDAVSRGMPMADAFKLYGEGIFAPTMGKRYNVHGVGLVDESGRVLAPVPKTKSRPIPVGGVGLVDPDTGQVLAAPPQTETVTDVIPASEGTPGSPAIPARAGIFGIGARPAVPAVPATPATPERRITRKVPIERPATAAKPIPSNKDALVKGERYSAKGRTWIWDGTKFVAAT